MKVACRLRENSRDILEIFLDNELWKQAHKSIIGLRPSLPHEVSLADLEEAFTALERKGALCHAMKKLAMKSYSTFEMRRILEEKLVSSEMVEQVIEDCIQRGYLNDGLWLESFVSNQTARRKGPGAIRQKLRLKGVPLDQIEGILSSMQTKEGQQEQITYLLKTRYKSRRLKEKKERDKVIASLMRRGFDLNEIFITLKTSLNNH
jgi:regulatory protein